MWAWSSVRRPSPLSRAYRRRAEAAGTFLRSGTEGSSWALCSAVILELHSIHDSTGLRRHLLRTVCWGSPGSPSCGSGLAHRALHGAPGGRSWTDPRLHGPGTGGNPGPGGAAGGPGWSQPWPQTEAPRPGGGGGRAAEELPGLGGETWLGPPLLIAGAAGAHEAVEEGL